MPSLWEGRHLPVCFMYLGALPGRTRFTHSLFGLTSCPAHLTLALPACLDLSSMEPDLLIKSHCVPPPRIAARGWPGSENRAATGIPASSARVPICLPKTLGPACAAAYRFLGAIHRSGCLHACILSRGCHLLQERLNHSREAEPPDYSVLPIDTTLTPPKYGAISYMIGLCATCNPSCRNEVPSCSRLRLSVSVCSPQHYSTIARKWIHIAALAQLNSELSPLDAV